MNSQPNRNFQALLKAQWKKKHFICVGLDSDISKLPANIRVPNDDAESQFLFNQAIIDATHDIVCAYKPNTAFYEALGNAGLKTLHRTIDYIRQKAPHVPIILDAKRADIGNTNRGYVQEAFEHLQADAITVHPYLGGEALQPFLEYKDKGIIVLCKTSNSGSGEFQNLMIDGKPLYQIVAKQVSHAWNTQGNCALVVGATYPEELRQVRKIIGDDMPILIPGIGAQGGDLIETFLASKNSRGNGIIISASRSIIFASNTPDFAEMARVETLHLNQALMSVSENNAS
jgi:orotidine-5'-phosphate decarboxylase